MGYGMSLAEVYPAFKPFLVYSASAGSGKTFALSARYISLLFMGESANTILAATFTNKAAAEMRQRVIETLQSLGERRSEAFLDVVVIQTGLDKETILQKQPEVLAKFLATHSHIVTLDSFFASILRAASLVLGIEPDFVTKEQGEEKLEAYFLEEVDRSGLVSDLVKLAIDLEDKRFTKIFTLMQDFYKIDPLLPHHEVYQEQLIKQEAVCETLQQDMIKALKEAKVTPRAVKQFETTTVKQLFGKSFFEKQDLAEHAWFKKVVNPQIDSLYHALKEALAKWSEIKTSFILENLFRLYSYYKNATIKNAKVSGILTFDDLSYFTYRLLYESISREFLYFKIDAKFKHILLDEFQDTSTLQFFLLKPLIDEIFDGEGQSEFRSFFYVGDTKQSLYRFRGGVEALFDKVAQNYRMPVEQMDTNYRSAIHLVEQVNQWFLPTMEGYIPQKSHSRANEGYVKVLESEEVISEAIEQAKKLLALGIDVDDIAFLVSTNRDGQHLQEACYQAGIETLLKTASSLKHLPKIAAIVAMSAYLFYGERIDAEALLVRIGKRIDKVDLSWFSVFLSPLQVLDNLVKCFGYFEKDLNILRLLEFASGFSDIPTFIEEFARSTISVASNTIHGAKIMTIHSAKGLEFAYVIVLDKLTQKRSDNSALLYNYSEDLHIENIFYRMKGREHFDIAYAKVLEARKIETQKDSLNLLYVALTRAIEGLIVIRKPKASLFDEIGMVPLQRGEISSTSTRKVTDKEILDYTVLSHYGRQERVKAEEEEEKDYLAMRFGTALHYGLEMLGGFDEESLVVSMMAVKNKFGQQLTPSQIQAIEDRVRHLIENETFQSLLQDATIRKEQSLSFEGQLKQIDLLLEYKKHALVIDYKSSKKYALKHQKQVAYYQKAIGKILEKRCEGMVVYLLDHGIEFQETS